MLVRILGTTIAILIGGARAAEVPSRSLTYAGMNDCPKGGCPQFTFDKGYLFQMKDSGSAPPTGLTVYNPEGRFVYQADITAPDGTPAYLYPSGVAVDTEGTVILAMYYGGYGGGTPVKGGGIVVLDRTGKQQRFIDTGRYMPAALCFSPDHSIWTIGAEYGRSRDGEDRGIDYFLVRKYSLDGKQTGTFLPRLAFPPGLPPGSSGASWMRASQDRIGIMTYPGRISNSPEWVELDLAGNLIGRWKLGPQYIEDPITPRTTFSLGGFAFTADGRLFAETDACPAEFPCSQQLALFDRTTLTWQPSDRGVVDGYHRLLGADGGDLVLWDRRNQTNPRGVHLVWAQVTPGH